MNGPYLDFEKPLAELEHKIEELKSLVSDEKLEMWEEISRLEKKAERLRRDIYSKLTPWQRVLLARHPKRPYTLDYIELMMTDFLELHGDRLFGDDAAIVGGLAWLDGQPIIVVGQQKGKDTKEKIKRNWGMARPEGYRKALRLFQMATKFKRPIVTLVDTPGAWCGIDAEERGQSEAIARNLREMSILPVPIVVCIIGEGGSGGALGIAVGDRILMMENAIYSVISPEGCASILWRDSSKAPQAAQALKLTAQDLYHLKVIDKIVPEPLGGAHRQPTEAANILKVEILKALNELKDIPTEDLIKLRIEKFSQIGIFSEELE
ncbi:MAG: acetyl-CoA carboxylase carboxyltransferase subunit alpha [Candidatus Edwardsbacteria bacterium]